MNHFVHSSYSQPNQHLRLKLNGNRTKIDFFKFACGSLDVDFPYAGEEFNATSAGPSPSECARCHGLSWRMPVFSGVELMRLAWQVHDMNEIPGNLKVRIRHLREAKVCDPAPPAQPLSIVR